MQPPDYRDSKPRERIQKPDWQSIRPLELSIQRKNVRRNIWGFLNLDRPIDIYNIWVWAVKPNQLWELKRSGNVIPNPNKTTVRNIHSFVQMHHYGLVTKLSRRNGEAWLEVWREAKSVAFRPWQGNDWSEMPIKPERFSLVRLLSHETNCWVRDRIIYDGGFISEGFQKALERK